MLTPQSAKDFSDARQKAFIEEWLDFFTGRSSELLPFEEVRQKLRLADAAYKGLQEIELDKIVGSTGRYRDFTRLLRCFRWGRYTLCAMVTIVSRWPATITQKL